LIFARVAPTPESFTIRPTTRATALLTFTLATYVPPLEETEYEPASAEIADKSPEDETVRTDAGAFVLQPLDGTMTAFPVDGSRPQSRSCN
jgi:hypothetical protein